MPPLNSAETRRLVKEAKVIPGPKSLHRGIHINQNVASVKQFKANPNGQRHDHKELLVHHQKINEDLQDIYARTAALHKDNMTIEERIEQSWKDAERIGIKRPKARVGFAQHLSTLNVVKKEERKQADVERATSGETIDYSNGSALHNAKDRRIKNFQRKQLKRAHTLKRFGDPTPLKQSGKYNDSTATLNVFSKTIRKVKREVAQDARVREVKSRRSGARSMWDLRASSGDNINRPTQEVVRYTREFDIGSAQRPSKKRRTQ